MNAMKLKYAMAVVLYLRGDGEATDAMIEHITETRGSDIPYTTLTGDDSTVDEWMADQEFDFDDFGLTQDEFTEAEDELARLDSMERDDDPGSVGYLRRKDAMERA